MWQISNRAMRIGGLLVCCIGWVGGWQNQVDDAAVIFMRQRGCEPKQVPLTAGKVLLVVYDDTNLAHVNVKVLQAGGALVAQGQTGAGRRWMQTVSLSPGTYTITDDRDARWTCTLQVKSK